MTTTFPSTLKLSPLFIGFENIFDNLEKLVSEPPNYPPYNIISLDKDHWEIEVALAGFTPDNIEVYQEDGNLIIQSSGIREKEGENRKFLHKGISTRKFRLVWKLAQWVEVKEVVFRDGILVVSLERNIPENLRPKKIEIKTSRMLQ
ncbi:MAG: Hsp20 family protein [Candidatus Pacearchaeota archaeon]